MPAVAYEGQWTTVPAIKSYFGLGLLAARRFSTEKDATAELRRRALAGDVPCAAELGKMYLDASHTDTRHWLELAAEREFVESQYLLGVHLNDLANMDADAAAATPSDAAAERGEMSREGREKVLKDIEEAKKDARRKRKDRLQKKRRGAAAGLGPGQSLSLDGSWDTVEAAEAPMSDADLCVYWLRSAGRAGHGPAMCYLGNVLLQRHRAGGPIGDGQEALLWYQRAGNLQPIPQADAFYNLGTLCFSGQPGLVEVDLGKSMQYFERGAECGDVSCLFWVGYCHLTGEGGAEVNVDKGMAFLSRAAEADHPSAHYHLAVAYRSGQAPVSPGAQPSREELGTRHLEAAADLGDGDALFVLANMCLDEASGGVADSAGSADRGIAYLRRAVAACHTDATVTLGALFYAGNHVPQDKRKAFELYNTAAEQGSKEAWRNLASMYFLGDGIPKSEEIAREIMKTIFGKIDGSVSKPSDAAST